MRPVNLLPEEYRPRRASGSRPGSAYAVVGLLGVLLAMVTVYVLTTNQVNAHKADAAEARFDAERAQARIGVLGPFGNFTQIKQVRVSSVTGLAQARFDWERFVRELALVLPRGTWLSEVDATASGAAAPGGASGAAAAAGPGAPVAGPNAKLTGCASHQPDVAKLMVRLREMHRVADVELGESARSKEAGNGAVVPSPAAGPAAGTDCPGRYKFDVTVRFAEATPAAPGDGAARVPASLGGGQ